MVSIREPARHNDYIGVIERPLFVPDETCIRAYHMLDCMIGIVITIRSWKNENPEIYSHENRTSYEEARGMKIPTDH